MKRVFIFFISMFLFLNITNADFEKFSYIIEWLPNSEIEKIEKRLENMKKIWNINKNILEKIENILDKELESRWELKELWVNHILDFDSLENVVWLADNVFIAEVLENNWLVWWIIPETKFKVKVIYNIKWNLKWELDLIQDWWNWFVTEWTELLKVDGVYILSIKWNNIMSNENSSKFLYTKRYLKYFRNSKESENEIILWSNLLSDFRNAYKNENNFSNKNNYKNLSKEEKNNFEKIENWFVK